MDEDLIDSNPAAKVKRIMKEQERERVLSDNEIIAFWKACDRLGYPYGDCSRLLLLTGQRLREVAHAEWREVDLPKAVWIVPGSRAKNGKSHLVHLSDSALTILQSLPRAEGNPYVFTTKGHGSRGSKIAAFASAKVRLDKHMPDVPHWTFHDLRRTVTTQMAEELGVAPHVTDKILNHVSGTIKGVARVYQRAEFLKERKAALDAWADYVEALVNPSKASNVVELREATAPAR